MLRDVNVNSHFNVIVDIGAGGGLYSCGMYTLGILAEYSSFLVAIDPNMLFCQIINKRANGKSFCHINSIKAIGEQLPLKDQCVDIVLCTEVLTYMLDDRQGLLEIHRLLKQGGETIISVPLPPEPSPVNGALHEGYTPKQLVILLESVGFKIIDCKKCMYGLSRLSLWADYFCWQATRGKLHLPILFMAYLERWLDHKGIRFGSPYCLIVRAIK